ncbi:MAG: hypothetical protein JW940_06235 [Polyangiaceae bacterium]|nr:hypothetical protein [Polyangiaceae bacterium]
MTAQTAVANTSNKTVTYGGTTYKVQELSDDNFAVLLEGVPIGRIVYSFGSAHGVPEGGKLGEEDLETIGEAWFAALEG